MTNRNSNRPFSLVYSSAAGIYYMIGSVSGHIIGWVFPSDYP